MINHFSEHSMRIVTWNVRGGKNGLAKWKYVTDLKPDIVCLQECRPACHYLDQAQLLQSAPYPPLWENIENMNKGVFVYTNGLRIVQLPLNRFRGRVMAATVTPRPEMPDMRIVVICVHVPTMDKVFKTAKEAAGQIFDDLAPLLQCSPYVILAGDLNLTVHYSPADVPVRDRLVKEFGLVNCTKYITDRARLCMNEVSTLRGYPHQDDYIFTSPTLKVNSFNVLADTALSDHYPVVADVNFPA